MIGVNVNIEVVSNDNVDLYFRVIKADYGTSCEVYTTLQHGECTCDHGRLVAPSCVTGFYGSVDWQNKIIFAETDTTYYIVAESLGLTPGSVAFKVVEHSTKCGVAVTDTLINLSFARMFDESV